MIDIDYIKKYEPIDGKWYVTKELGRGAFGTVFEIERKDFGDIKAALKVVSIPASQAEVNSYMDENYDLDEKSVTAYFYGFVEEIVKEFQLMSHLKGDSNIVSYEDHDVKRHENGMGWDVFIRMELLTPINKYFSKNTPKQSDVIRLGIDICKALEVCQKYKIIHRDIKPSNIFMSKTGNFKLGDFGVARTLERTSSGLSKKGTYTYMAPEVFNGKEYGSNVDIYSLGIVLYKLLNNNLEPFRKERTYDDEENALVARMQGKKKIPKPANADGRLAEIVLKACSYDPKYRYESPLQMREELENILYTDTESKIIYPNGDEVNYEPSTSNSMDKFNNENEKTTGLFESDNGFEQTETVGLFGTSQEQTKYDAFDEKTETVGMFSERNNDVELFSENNKDNKKTTKIAVIIATVTICLLVGIGILTANRSNNKIEEAVTDIVALIEITDEEDSVILNNDEITSVEKHYDTEMGYYLLLSLNSLGQSKFSQYTNNNIGKTARIYINKTLISSPVISDSIDSADIIISGDFSEEDVDGFIEKLHTEFDVSVIEETVSTEEEQTNTVTHETEQKQIETTTQASQKAGTTTQKSQKTQQQTTQQQSQSQQQTTQQQSQSQQQTTQQQSQSQQQTTQQQSQSQQQTTQQQSQSQQQSTQQQSQQQTSCPVCGSKYHTVHPTSDAPTIDKEFD